MIPHIASQSSLNTTPRSPSTTAHVAAPTAASAATAPQASPVSLLDPSTGLVVLEFFDAKGDETASLPTRKQLDLYRLNEASPNVFAPAIHDVAAPASTGLRSDA